MMKLSIKILCISMLVIFSAPICAVYGQNLWSERRISKKVKSKATNFSAVYSLTDKNYERRTYLWIGDDTGGLFIINNPDDDNVAEYKADKITTIKESISDIYFKNPTDGYLISGSNIYVTADGGKSWTIDYSVPKKDGATATLNSIGFFQDNKSKGCAVGFYSRGDDLAGSLIVCGESSANDSKKTIWSVHSKKSVNNQLFHVYLFKNNQGWAVGGEGMILHTNNGGNEWKIQKPVNQIEEALFRVDFCDEKNGLTVGENGKVLITTDGGQVWKSVIDETLNSLKETSLISAKYLDQDNILIVGYDGIILSSVNSGLRWTNLSIIGMKKDLNALFIDENYCWAVGNDEVILRRKRK